MILDTRPANLPVADSARVVDIGGGMNPHPRADYVIDLETYDSARSYGNQLRSGRFNLDTWIIHDICSIEPFPFEDKFFDFAVCTHVLEDVRDPIRVCHEMMRIAKAGYIEVPSIESELTYQLETRHYSGRWHHRWLVEANESGLTFRFKPAFVNGYWKTRIPRKWWTSDPCDDVLGFLWEGRFSYREEYYAHEELWRYLEDFVRSHRCYSPLRYYLWELAANTRRRIGKRA
jgi:SAM-dependent methyltransferase